MNPAVTSLLVFAGIFAAGLLAMRIRAMLPQHHLTSDTKDAVKLSMALVATMTALLISLMIASAKSTYDAQKTSIVTTAANLVVLDRMLEHYGPEAKATRELLRRSVEGMLVRIWPETPSSVSQLNPSVSSGDVVFDSIQSLAPRDDSQRALKTSALGTAISLGQMRWMLFEESGHSISATLLGFVIAWLAILFFSFGLFAPANGTSIAALMVSAISVAAAIFLILELDQPFDGLIRIPNAPMHSALNILGR